MKNTLLIFALMMMSLFSYGQIIQFADANFKYALVNTSCADFDNDGIEDDDVDTNNDGEIQISEALRVYKLNLFAENINDIKGINHFKILKWLAVNENNLTSISLNDLPQLERLDCKENKLKTLELVKTNNLNILDCRSNNLTSLSLNKLKNLAFFDCRYNQIKDLNLDSLTNLVLFWCSSNQLSEINFNNLTKLKEIYCAGNLIKKLSLKNLPSLNILSCFSNQLTSLDLSDQKINLYKLECTNNKLDSLFIKNGSTIEIINLDYNPSLKYICCNDNEIGRFTTIVNNIGIEDCEINSYCSFTPGGKFYSISGNVILDIENNGCDNNDSASPNLKFNISSINATGTIVSNSKGNYFIPVQEGTHTIKPIFENPDYFYVSPDSITVTFPSTYDTIIQKFCITPKGIHNQVDLSIIPLTPPARPGFDAHYKVVMTSKGNQVENGTLYFAYDEAKMDFVSTDVNPSKQSDGLLSWDFTNLLPFETRYCNVTLNVNSPSETPPVNAGDELLITCNILENVFLLKQEVVGSYDPNDKTCLEGKTITPDQVGEYVHYLIRFENTGNYAAENVVVKDVIDPSTFDISTLQITDASHETWARIDGNIVEFIFENIQLPFVDASNDGYICFKIKTKPTLVLGNELKNEANIYFDYNLPILTNKTNTVVAIPVSTDEANGESDIEIFPNPVNDVLKFSGYDKILKVEIFDMSGRLVQVSSVVDGEVNVDTLLSGMYQFSIKTMDGTVNKKFSKL